MAQIVEVMINKVQLGVHFDEDAGVFVGFCPRFSVYSQGETKEEALEATTCAIALRFATAFDHGRLDKILFQAGLGRITPGTTAGPPSQEDEFVAFRINQDLEITEKDIRVPIGALLHQRSLECQQ